MNVVLIEPEIPPNTGNIARLCAVTNSRLHLIEPLGFSVDDKHLKRAGLDYWEQLDWQTWKSWDAFQNHLDEGARCWFIETGGKMRYTDVKFREFDFIIFGRETKGIPSPILNSNAERWIKIPMFNKSTRSLNLSNCVSIVLYEALRQSGFAGETD